MLRNMNGNPGTSSVCANAIADVIHVRTDQLIALCDTRVVFNESLLNSFNVGFLMWQ